MPVPKGSTLDPERTRAALLASATEIFYERGLDGVGVAELCRAVGASKETLYRHFGSKDGLVEAVLSARSDRVVHWLTATVEAAGADPRAQLAALFDALGDWYRQPGFRGCAIVNAATQHHAPPAAPAADRHLGRYQGLLTSIAERAGVSEPQRLGRQLLILLEGATVVADHHDPDGLAAQDAKRAALTLLAAEGV